jgi:hypothetical protein
MEPRPVNRSAWIAAAVVGVVGILLAAIVFDLGPFADEDLTRAEFLAQGDEICSQAHRDYEKLQGRPPRTASEASELTGELLAISREELDAIVDLKAPAELSTALERYLKAREAGIERLREGVDAAEAGDAFAYAKAQSELASTQEKRAALARDVGFDVCSEILFGRGQLESDAQPPLSADPGAPPTVSNPPTGAP